MPSTGQMTGVLDLLAFYSKPSKATTPTHEPVLRDAGTLALQSVCDGLRSEATSGSHASAAQPWPGHIRRA
jgi:hypothetical protein